MTGHEASLRTGVVCSVSSRPEGAEVVVRLGAEQWLVTTVARDCRRQWQLRVGQPVLIDPATEPFRIFPCSGARMIDLRHGNGVVRRWLAGLWLACAAYAGHCADTPSLSVQGVKPDAVRYSLAELRALPLRKLRVEFAPGRNAECEGVTLADVLAQSGLAMGKALRGARLSEYLLVTARDGYAVVFALTELDPEFTDTPALLCLALDGAAIPDDTGPLRLVVPQEKRHARWVRQVTGLSLRKAM